MTVDAYFRFMKDNKEDNKLEEDIRRQRESLDTNDSKNLQELAVSSKDKISCLPMPADIAWQIKEDYHKLEDEPVAVRSSTRDKNLPEASFAGQLPPVYLEFTEKLVSWGIAFASVGPDMINETGEYNCCC